MTIVEFLKQRLDEDEAAAEQAASGSHDSVLDRDDFGRLLIRPDRMLAQVAAMRRLMAYAEGKILAADRASQRGGFYDAVTDGAVGDKILQLLALPYASHPDYDPAWAPDA